jgi:hypothetical protein
MSERQRIEERLRKKEQEIQSLEEKLKAARVYVQALHDVLKLLSAESEPATPGETVLRPGSSVAQARDVILERGEPVHINNILEAMGKKVTRDSRASLTSSLSAYVRRGEIFTRPAPNTFGLAELGHDTIEDATETPPEGFGRIADTAPSRTTLKDELDDEVPF